MARSACPQPLLDGRGFLLGGYKASYVKRGAQLQLSLRLRYVGLGLAAAFAAFAIACGSDDGDEDGGFDDDPTPIAGVSTAAVFPLSIERSDGETLTLAQPPAKIVSLSPGATEILYAIGAESALTAVDNNADYPPAAANFATKVDAFEPNVESIIALAPDLVIVASDIGGLVDALDRADVPVLYIDLDTDVKTIDSVFGQIGLMGRITGREQEALDLIAGLTARVKAIEAKLTGLPNTRGPRLYHELDSTFYSISEDTFIGNVYRTLKARNIAGDGGGVAYPQLTQEKIIADNPEVIVLADEEFGVTIDSVKARPGWSAISAVQNDRIYAVDPDIISRPGPRIVDALEQLAAQLYPNTFGEGGGEATPMPTPTPVRSPVPTAVGTPVAATPAQ